MSPSSANRGELHALVGTARPGCECRGREKALVAHAVVARGRVLEAYVVGAEIGGEVPCVPHDDVRRWVIVVTVVGTRGCDEGAEPRGVPAGPSLEPVGGLERGAGERIAKVGFVTKPASCSAKARSRLW